MSTTKEIYEGNSTVARLKLMLGEHFIRNTYSQKFVFEKVDNINYRISPTNYLLSHHTKWIGSTILHFAVENMDSEAVDILLSRGADFTLKNSSDSTALHQLVEDKPNLFLKMCDLDNSFIKSIISAHVKYNNFENPVNANGLSHFHLACAVNNVEVVKGFLKNEVSIDHTVNFDSPLFAGFTSLHFAAQNCAFEVIEILLSRGASVQKKNMEGMLPLHIVLQQKLHFIGKIRINEAMMGRIDRLLKLLLEKESNDDMMIDDWGLSHFHVVCSLKDSKIAESYLQKVVNINDTVNGDSPLWPGYTALHFAALCSLDTFKLLMKKGADISIKDSKGITPFDICIERYRAEDVYAVISWNPDWKKIMLSDGKTKLTDLVFAMRSPHQFDLFLKKISKNFNICNSVLWPGYTPMHLAVLLTKSLSSTSEDATVQILKNLCKRNPAMLCSKEVHGYTPLHLAYRLKKNLIIDLLLEFLNKVRFNLIDHVDEGGLSYLHIAAAKNNVPLLKRMLSIGSDVNAIYKGKSSISHSIYPGSTALHFAVANGSAEAAELLMKKGADVYAKDANDMTPIHLLLLNPEASVVLLSLHLRDSVARAIGLSHLHVVCWWDQPKIVDRLLDFGADINGVITYQPSEKEFPFVKKFNGYTPTLMAYEEGNLDTMTLLLKRGADVFVADSKGKALMYAILECISSLYYELFVELATNRIDVRTRLMIDTGMTELHVACLDLRNFAIIEKLLNEGADANAQIRADSPIFQGYTPLHVVVRAAEECCDEVDVDRALELLVKAGADVTLQAGNSKTAVHMAWEKLHDEDAERYYIRVNELLEAQRDFSVNPANVGGMTHFHVACNVCNTGIIQKFLSHSNVDVDEQIDFFRKNFTGYSALHLATAYISVPFCQASRRLRAVDLLLNYGANVHVRDKHGETPLHECARLGSLDVFERLVSGEADLNAENYRGNTPLYCYLKFSNPSVEGLRRLLRFGCHLNVFDVFSGEGFIGLAVCKLPYADMQSFFDAIIINFKQELKADDLDRTIIHNIVSISSYKVSATEYAAFINQLSETNCDVDDQDHLGRTALHVAATFHNYKGISGLLMFGADVNMIDVDGKVAFACEFGTCSQCSSYGQSTDESSDEEDEDEELCEHLQSKKTLSIHIKKLQYCGLDVNKQNEDLACKAFEEMFKSKTKWSEGFFEELDAMKNTTIGSYALTLHNFMSENGAVADYPTMSLMKREAINKFFSSSKIEFMRKNFPEVSGILQLQYRKAMARPQLVESAKNAMTLLVGFRLPEICSHFILIPLKNSDLKSLISSTVL